MADGAYISSSCARDLTKPRHHPATMTDIPMRQRVEEYISKLQDDIVAACLMAHEGTVRRK